MHQYIKNYSDMKRLLVLTILVLGRTLLPHVAINAQTYYNFAFAEATNNSGKGLIRAVDRATAVSYYQKSNGDQALALISLFAPTTINEVIIDPNVQSVEDLRVADNYVFFCGKKSGEGFIGCIPLVDMVTSTPTVNYTSVGDESVEHFHSMVAYKHGPNVKVVAVGEYHWHDNTSSSSYGNCSVGYHLCARRPIAEFTFSGSTGILMNLWTSDDGVRVECANEVIETPTHVAIICYYTDNRAITIHYCDKANVYGTFSNFYYYSAPEEGHSFIHGCHMYDEVIALSSLSTYYDAAGQQQFSTKIRVIDLATMTNIHAQQMPLYTKSEPLELVYVPNGQFLVLLQDAVDPATLSAHNYFTNINYSATAPYNTKCWYETARELHYQSADMLTDSHLIATGEKGFLMQNAPALSPSSGCYKVDS